MEIDTRIKELLDEFGITPYVLANAISVSNSTISRILHKGAKPRASNIKKISNYFNVYEKWLMTGKGVKDKVPQIEMNKVVNNIISGESISIIGGNKFIDVGRSNYIMLVPLITEKFHFAFLSKVHNKKFYETLPYHPVRVSDPHKGFYLSFEVVGGYMTIKENPCVKEGYIVTGRKLDRELWISRMVFKTYKLFIVVHKEGIIVGPIEYSETSPELIKCRGLELKLKDCVMILNILEFNFHL